MIFFLIILYGFRNLLFNFLYGLSIKEFLKINYILLPFLNDIFFFF